jgi:hypothetical protein
MNLCVEGGQMNKVSLLSNSEGNKGIRNEYDVSSTSIQSMAD